MANLSELTKYRNELLEKLKVFDLTQQLEDKINLFDIIKDNNPTVDQESLNKFIIDYDLIKSQNNEILNHIKNHIDQVTQDIDQIASGLHDNDDYRKKFTEEVIHQLNTGYNMEFDAAVENHFTSKISGYSDWRHPALQINPRSRKIVDYMVSGDPLYLTSHDTISDISNLKNIVSSYPEMYQRRLRVYEIKDRNFLILPQGKFGFVLCWDTFNYLSIEKIETYLKEVFKLLKPGGVFMFSYNNCDIERSVTWAEIAEINCGGQSYVTFRALDKIIKSIGYDIISKNDTKIETSGSYISWLELSKPGTLTTLKAHQALAQIIPK